MNRYFNQKQSADSTATGKLVSAFVKPNKDDGNSCPADAIKMKLQGQDACRTVCWDTEDKSRPEGKKGSKTTTGQCAGYPGLTFSKSSWTISGPGGQNFTNAFDILDGKQNRCDTLHNIGPFDDQCCTGGAGSKCEKKGQDSWGWAYGEGLFPYEYSTAPPTCPGTPACSGHGTCSGGNCSCTLNTGWSGTDCSKCKTGWYGANCDKQGTPSGCSVALQWQCQGNNCTQTCCPDVGKQCSLNNTCGGECQKGPPSGCGQPLQYECVGNQCTQTCCPDGGKQCSSNSTCDGACEAVSTCPGVTPCSDHGTCDASTGHCSCNPGWDQPDCSRYSGTEGDKGGGNKGIVIFLSVVAGIIFLVIIGMIVFLFISSRKPKGAAGAAAPAAQRRPRKTETVYY